MENRPSGEQMGQFRPMFSINMEHTYFRSGRLDGVRFTPTASTKKLMRDVNLVSRPRSDGLTLFYDGEYIEALRLYAADVSDPLRMEFNCDVEHQDFQNFTVSPISPMDKTLYFDSDVLKIDSSGKNYLHAGEFVSEDELVEISSLASLTDELSRDQAPSLGKISIRVSDEDLDYLESSRMDNPREYTIRFSTRSTHWKYYLLGEVNRQGVYLKDTEGEVEFEYLGEETIANGRVAKIYISKTAIPMRERAKQKFQLIVNKNDRPKILVNRLAVANSKRVNRVMHNNKSLLVSEIYVNY